MTTHALYDFTITVVPPVGTAPSTHTVRATTARHAIATHDPALATWQIHELQRVARVMVDGTIYIAAPKNATGPAAQTTGPMRVEIPMPELEG